MHTTDKFAVALGICDGMLKKLIEGLKIRDDDAKGAGK